MPLQLKYFASIREALGPGESFEFAAGRSLGELRDALIARGGSHAEALARFRLRFAHWHGACRSLPLAGRWPGVERTSCANLGP